MSAAGLSLQLARHGQFFLLQVDVAPAQAQGFTNSQATEHEHGDQRLIPVARDGFQESLNLWQREKLHVGRFELRRLDLAHRRHRNDVVVHRCVQRCPKNAVDLVDAALRQPIGGQLGVERPDV